MKKGRPQRLKPDAVREIREWYARWTTIERPQVMANKHGCNKSLLHQIGRREIYKDAQP